jgi:ribonuclease T1
MFMNRNSFVQASQRTPVRKAACARAWLGVAAAVLVMGAFASNVQAKGLAPGSSAEVQLSALPKEARDTHSLILNGGPFPYDKDGTVFGNRERLLPRKDRGYYREYTVKTPGERTRGARRIVCGGKTATKPDHCYYTADHYASFQRIVGASQ